MFIFQDLNLTKILFVNIRDCVQCSINYVCNRGTPSSLRANESKTARGGDKLKKAKGGKHSGARRRDYVQPKDTARRRMTCECREI